MDSKILKIVVYSDISFASNTDLNSQFGIFVLLREGNDHLCTILYASWKFRRKTRSVLAAEVHAFPCYLDCTLAFTHEFASITSVQCPVVVCADSNSLFDTISKLTSVSEKRLLFCRIFQEGTQHNHNRELCTFQEYMRPHYSLLTLKNS